MFFILYLEWIMKMFPGQRSLLIVDRATTHHGEMIDKWLKNNHNSDSASKVFIEYIPEGMTSIMQVWEVVINKPLKDKIKKQYYSFRDECIQDAPVAKLSGTGVYCSSWVSCGDDGIGLW
jgi:hypothetical protein